MKEWFQSLSGLRSEQVLAHQNLSSFFSSSGLESPRLNITAEPWNHETPRFRASNPIYSVFLTPYETLLVPILVETAGVPQLHGITYIRNLNNYK
tara:strand:- start:465 stop:749 length:285 start_codon:yes stop_codon:yes gene_type:complete